MNNSTPQLNSNSIHTVRGEINKKITRPFFANSNTVREVVTDMDHHPYTRWFRGVYYYPDPVIMEREAGWRPLENNCYNINIPKIEEKEPHHCFEVPCTTTLPCYPQYLTKYADRDALDVMINNACVVGYR